jgi:hypothetical protein
MKLETFKSPTNEVFLEFDGGSVTVNPWSNCEGVSIMVHGKDLSLRMAGAFRWEEIDAIIVALTAARAV